MLWTKYVSLTSIASHKSTGMSLYRQSFVTVLLTANAFKITSKPWTVEFLTLILTLQYVAKFRVAYTQGFFLSSFYSPHLDDLCNLVVEKCKKKLTIRLAKAPDLPESSLSLFCFCVYLSAFFFCTLHYFPSVWGTWLPVISISIGWAVGEG